MTEIDDVWKTIEKAIRILVPYARVLKTGRKHLRNAYKELNYARKLAKKVKEKKHLEKIQSILLLAEEAIGKYKDEAREAGTFAGKFEKATDAIILEIANAIKHKAMQGASFQFAEDDYQRIEDEIVFTVSLILDGISKE